MFQTTKHLIFDLCVGTQKKFLLTLKYGLWQRIFVLIETDKTKTLKQKQQFAFKKDLHYIISLSLEEANACFSCLQGGHFHIYSIFEVPSNGFWWRANNLKTPRKKDHLAPAYYLSSNCHLQRTVLTAAEFLFLECVSIGWIENWSFLSEKWNSETTKAPPCWSLRLSF